ncbi:MAG TPA: PKD domain-containing protein [Candidatus Polarisedimenticolia bacterium]
MSRSLHTAVWTGQEMIVWGGKSGSLFQNTGARYVPGSVDACGGEANQPPEAVAGADQSLECVSHQGTSVSLDGTLSTDPDGDPLTYIWTGPFPEGGGLVEGATPTVSLPLGQNVITLTVDDGNGHSSTDDVTITVQDTLAPELGVSIYPASLWSPNHRMVPVRMTVAARDLCDVSPSIVLVSIVSSEPDDASGAGDGATVNDVQGVSAGSADFDFDLRAERDGEGEGRTYSIVYRAMDASGNSVETTTFVLVPHDRRSVTEPAGGAPRVEAPRRAVLLSGRCSLTIRARGAPPHLRPGSSRPG